MKHISIIGATGSIGCNVANIVLQHPDSFRVVALAGHHNADEIVRQINVLQPDLVAVADNAVRQVVQKQLVGHRPEIMVGEDGLHAVAAYDGADMFVSSVVGGIGLKPLMTAIESGKDIAFANKEAMVMAGKHIMSAVDKYGVTLIPVDSEHSGIFQCLQGEQIKQVRKVTLTASGGPFKDKSLEFLQHVTPEQAIKHPRWSMGRKISVDSATLMNKVFEVIEAKWTFDLSFSEIDIVIHPESIVHAMVEFIDKSVIAQLGVPDMRIAIQYALSYPERLVNDLPTLDLIQLGALTFFKPDASIFKALTLGLDVAKQGGTLCAVLNAANEVAVQAFLDGQIGFLDIVHIIEDICQKTPNTVSTSLEDICVVDQKARQDTYAYIKKKWLTASAV